LPPTALAKSEERDGRAKVAPKELRIKRRRFMVFMLDGI
jgi:hypothetical protein